MELKMHGLRGFTLFVHNKDMLSVTMTNPYGSTYTILSSASAGNSSH